MKVVSRHFALATLVSVLGVATGLSALAAEKRAFDRRQ